MTDTQALVERLRLLDRHASAAPWQGYSEPDVNLPYSLFQGVPMQPGFGPLEPLTGYDVDLVAEMRNGLPAILAELERMAAEVEKANATVRRVQAAAKTIMIGEADELARLRAQAQEHHLAIKTLDSEREANALLTEENERLRAALKRCAEIVDRNLYRQHEKVADVCLIVRRALGGSE